MENFITIYKIMSCFNSLSSTYFFLLNLARAPAPLNSRNFTIGKDVFGQKKKLVFEAREPSVQFLLQ